MARTQRVVSSILTCSSEFFLSYPSTRALHPSRWRQGSRNISFRGDGKWFGQSKTFRQKTKFRWTRRILVHSSRTFRVSVYYLAREISPTIEQSDAPKFHDISSHAKVYLCNLLARISPKFCRSHYFHGSRGVFFLKNYMNCSFNVLPCKISLKVWKSK